MTNISHELFKEAKTQFADHLDIADNSRIIFSGKFGHGKTTFLKHYFNEAAQDKYNPIFLYPVNYSVSTNEDIFEYIKYDILVEMIRGERYEFKCDTSDFWDNVPFYIYKQPEKVISIILGMIPQLGKTAKGIFDELVELKKELKESFERYKKEQDDFLNIKGFLEDIEVKPGSIYDNGITTNIIRNAISKAKESDKKENVLIIDDLDRIDPEHIFRILNVFAAHFDSIDTLPNKFGFDKIIVVCDIENIRNIFRAKYGIDTDFNGYIDKFYSHKVFDYDIKWKMLDYLYNTFHQASFSISGDHARRAIIDEYRHQLLRNNDFFVHILRELINNGEIDMRNIVKWANKNIDYSIYSRYDKATFGFPDDYHLIILSIRLLADIKGGYGSLKTAVNRINILEPLRVQYEMFSSQLAYIYLVNEHRGNFKEKEMHVTFQIDRNKYILKLKREQGKDKLSINLPITNGYPVEFDRAFFLFLLNGVIDMIASKQIVFS